MRSGDSIVTIANFNEGIDLSSIDEDILPDVNNSRNLGSATKRWADLFLSGSTINLGGSTISSDGTGSIAISATGATLPVNSNVEITSGNKKNLALIDETTGTTIRSIPFF